MTALTINAPGLLGPWAAEHGAYVCQGLQAPALRLILARGRGSLQLVNETADVTHARVLADALGIDDHDAMAAACMTALADGMDPRPGSAWIRCDPVHLLAEPHGAQLTIGPLLRLGLDEAQALADSLNEELDVPWKIRVGTAERWYIEVDTLPDMRTSSPFAVLGPAVEPALPLGDNARVWRSWLTEVQMTLFAHRLNEQREQNRLPPINSLWLWGQGQFRVASRSCNATALFAHSYADHGFASGLGMWSGAQVSECAATDTLADVLRSCDATSHAVVDYPLFLRLAHAGLVEDWREAITAFEHNWFAPAVEALRQGGLSQLKLVHGYDAERTISLSLRASRWDLARFWRRPAPLERYVTLAAHS